MDYTFFDLFFHEGDWYLKGKREVNGKFFKSCIKIDLSKYQEKLFKDIDNKVKQNKFSNEAIDLTEDQLEN